MHGGLDRRLATPSALRALRRLVYPDSHTSYACDNCRRRQPYSAATAAAVQSVEDAEIISDGRPASQLYRPVSQNPTQQSPFRQGGGSGRNTTGLKPARRKFLYHEGPKKVHPQQDGSSISPDVPSTSVALSSNTTSKQSLEQLESKLSLPDHRNDIVLWTELLLLRQRVEGTGSVYTTWEQMRSSGVQLPVDGQHADVLWSTFLAAGIETPNSGLLEGVVDHAQQIMTEGGIFYSGLWETIVGGFIKKKDPYRASKQHHYLTKIGLEPELDAITRVEALVQEGRSSGAFKGKKFSQELRSLRRRLAEKSVIPVTTIDDTSLSQNLPLALEDVDHDEKEVEALPSQENTDTQLFEPSSVTRNPLVSAKGRSTSVIKAGTENIQENRPDTGLSLSRETMNRLLGLTHSVRPKELSDGFCARLYATIAFPPETVTTALAFLGVQKIGPLALRELGVRCRDAVELKEKLTDLRSRGIETSSDMFSRAVSACAEEDDNPLLLSILESDQHPDVYQDAEALLKLLWHYLDVGARRPFTKTMTILNRFHSFSTIELWNMVLQKHVRSRKLPSIMETVHKMRMSNVLLSEDTLRSIKDGLLPFRKRGNRTNTFIHQEFDALTVVANVFLIALDAGWVHPPLWREVIRRFGMMGRFDEVCRLCISVADGYNKTIHQKTDDLIDPAHWLHGHSQGDHTAPTTRTAATGATDAFNVIFSDAQQAAIIEWAFRSTEFVKLQRHHEKHGLLYQDTSLSTAPPWAEGLVLLRALQQRGVTVHTNNIRATVINRLWQLYGPGQSSRKLNRKAKSENPYALFDMVKYLHGVWDNGLFNLDPKYLSSVEARGPDLYLRIFGARRPIRKTKRLYLNVANWLRLLEFDEKGRARLARRPTPDLVMTRRKRRNAE